MGWQDRRRLPLRARSSRDRARPRTRRDAPPGRQATVTSTCPGLKSQAHQLPSDAAKDAEIPRDLRSQAAGPIPPRHRQARKGGHPRQCPRISSAYTAATRWLEGTPRTIAYAAWYRPVWLSGALIVAGCGSALPGYCHCWLPGFVGFSDIPNQRKHYGLCIAGCFPGSRSPVGKSSRVTTRRENRQGGCG